MVAAVQGRQAGIDTLCVGELVPAVVAVAPVGQAGLGIFVVGHVAVDGPAVDGAHRVTERAALGLDEVGRDHHLDGVGGFELALYEHAHALAVVLGNNTLVVHVVGRGVGAVLFVTAGERYVVLLHEAGAQEVVDVVVARVVGVETGTPAAVGVGGVDAVGTADVDVLQGRDVHDFAELPAAVDGDVDFAVLTALGGDDDDAVGAFLAVEGRGCGTFQHRHVLDIVGVDVADCRGTAADGHTVDDEQRLVGLCVVDRRDGADNHLAGRVGRATGHRYLYAGNLTLEGVDKVGRLAGRYLVALELLYAEVKFGLGLALAHGGYHNLAKDVNVGLKLDVDFGAGADLFVYCLISYKGELKNSIVVRYIN